MEKEIFIEIEGVKYLIRQSFRALMMFETITGRSIYHINQNLNDVVTLFYCVLSANNKDTFKFSLDEFIDLIDRNQDSIETFNSYLLTAAEAEIKDKKADNPSKKKKPQPK